MAAYVTAAEIKDSKIGFDFSGYSDELLNSYAELAKEVIDTYVGRKFGANSYNEVGETVVDRKGRIYVKIKNGPIDTVTKLEFWVPGSQHIAANLPYVITYKQQGYMYYPTSSAYGVYGATYPMVVLGHAESVSYEVEYTSADVIPALIKHASLQVVGNLLKPDYYYNETGVAGLEADVKSIRSGEFAVTFGGSNGTRERTNNGNENQKGQSIISPAVKELLNRFRSRGQNTY